MTQAERNHLLPKENDNKETQNKKKSFPLRIFFILGNEFCERYSFYGMRTILVLYLKYYLLWDSNTATAVYHSFNVLCYLFPLMGGVLADSRWGKYNTILWLSIVYAIGMIINALGAVGPLGNITVHAVLTCVGLFVIAIGTGGIKPCVSTFGGDQFDSDQEDSRRNFFSVFYFTINAGSLISTLVSPIIREQVKCFGNDCYFLAFGIPAILMITATIFFVAGTKWYTKFPPSGNLLLKVSKAVCKAIQIRWNTKKSLRTKDHWMDYALTNNQENAKLIRDTKYMLNILILYIPLPLFWTLFDQQGSRWTLQAVNMDGYIGSLLVLPDQMQICNPLLIVTLIPLLQVTLYPCIRKLNLNFSPLRRMTAGMLLAGLSFIVAALVNMKIDVHATLTPQIYDQTGLRIINSANCPLSINSSIYPGWLATRDKDGNVIGGLELFPGSVSNTLERFVNPGTFSVRYRCRDQKNAKSANVTLRGKSVYDLIISNADANNLKDIFVPHNTKKSDNGDAIVGVVNTFNTNIKVNGNTVLSNSKVSLSPMKRGTYKISIILKNVEYERNFTVKTGGLYTIVLKNSSSASNKVNLTLIQYTDIHPNDVNILWMIPQYFLMTLGEVFLSVTGLEFSYSQAPPSMKSVIQSIWLLTVAIGNIIVLIVAETRLIHKQTNEYFLFAGLIGVAAVIFIALAIPYKYVDESEFEEDLHETDGEVFMLNHLRENGRTIKDT